MGDDSTDRQVMGKQSHSEERAGVFPLNMTFLVNLIENSAVRPW